MSAFDNLSCDCIDRDETLDDLHSFEDEQIAAAVFFSGTDSSSNEDTREIYGDHKNLECLLQAKASKKRKFDEDEEFQSSEEEEEEDIPHRHQELIDIIEIPNDPVDQVEQLMSKVSLKVNCSGPPNLLLNNLSSAISKRKNSI
ncbi:hypothetical protein GUITHDRAFT_156169 [Guillardia theta CCMP2712]|uniref:Uncharacterized protein n=1 Tax=Guillardia theta (strain CCMP2712) TaxID=905079 RepID=L1IB10_GUITC|nr:hypothetical protein GUITHDRAFT_156169 [Guillardia theta CCMP2712]EKX33035.1 hypothetical protein GUITHDRAFT_156169 [Guillardia theta CCMP2712]|eukprot:XP_005820015.1 hypothetical protein GUITHDRAFT_156169 [Guillardia theta CCMP2712]